MSHSWPCSIPPVEHPSRSRLGCLTEVIIGELGDLILVFSKMCSVQMDQSGVESLSVLSGGHWFVIMFAKLGFFFSLGLQPFLTEQLFRL